MTFVLIPGAWHGAWAWHGVARRLIEAGRAALPLTMPGMAIGDDPRTPSLDDAVDYLVDEIVRRDLRDVVLVGHSWGGYPITGAAHRVPDRIAKIVYYSAAVPARGVSMNDENPPENAAYVRSMIDQQGFVPLYFEAVRQLLMQDEPEPLQRVAFDLMTPQPGRYMLDPLDADPIPEKSTFILADRDRALARPGDEFAKRLGVTPIMVPGTHESLLTHPDELTEALLRVER
ncbi:alpha/beta fold hydrolase [Actinoplanes sp. NPDC049265]|uniref:alpha/beta fold hydrolase n=1 Tax=Actinoplanes sp. NPDC049265 TaxID=3363902 RepID=UPI00371F9AAC